MERIENIDKKVMESKIRWALLTWVLWDALGVPTEMREQEFLKKKYWTINQFLKTKENPFFSKYGFDEEGVGCFSDDTVLTFAILKSLDEIWKIDMEDIWSKQIQWYHNHPYWFGSSTKKAFEKIEQWIPIDQIINPNGGWNGMMMKQFPLAAYFAVNNVDWEVEDKTMLDITKVSHWHPAALVSTLVHHHLLKKLLNSDQKNIDKKTLLSDLIKIAEIQESKFENREGKKISEVLYEIYCLIDNEWNLNIEDSQILEKFGWKWHIKNSGFVTTTLWIVYCLFFRDNSIKWLRDAVNFGWDTDTYASIIWNMIWALNGEIYDKTLLDKVQNIEELKQQTNDFISKLLS